MGAFCPFRKTAGLAVQRPAARMAARMGERLATALLTGLRMFLFPRLTAARRRLMADEMRALVEPAAVGELTGLRRRAEPVAVAVAEPVAVAVAEPVAVAVAEPVARAVAEPV
jgi:hypothetical protein